MLTVVPATDLEAWWPTLLPWFQSVEKRTRTRETVADLRAGIADQRYQLWLWLGMGIKALAVTEIIQHPEWRVCRVRIATGFDRHEWLGPGLQAIEQWAREIGCNEVEPITRRGWLKDLKALGYRPHHIVFGKELRP